MIRSLLSLPVRMTVRGFAAAVWTEPIPTLLFGAPDLPEGWSFIPSPPDPPMEEWS